MPVLPEVGSRIVAPGTQQPVLLRRRDHVERGPVLHRAGRVPVLELGPQPHVRARRQPRQPDQRRPAYGVKQGVVAHSRQPACRAACSQPAPPATAGSTVTVSPSLHRRGQAAEEPDVLVVQVHVDEPAQPGVIDQPLAQPVVTAVQVGEQLVEGAPEPSTDFWPPV